MSRDITALPDLAHGRAHPGPVRTERPVYVDLLPPGNAACPAGENIQGTAIGGNSRDRLCDRRRDDLASPSAGRALPCR